jgi:hypothetical protein
VSKPTEAEWNIISAVEEFWNRERFFPGSKILSEMTKLPEDFVMEVMTSGKFDKRFEALGIDKDSIPVTQKKDIDRNSARLTSLQLALASCLLNPMDQRSRSQKLKDLGILPITFNGWMKNEKFTKYLSDRADEMFSDMMPLAKDALIRKVMKGDLGALKLYMEMKGQYGKQNEGIQDFKLLVNRLIESIQRHVKDPAIVQAIAEDFKSITDPSPVIRSEIIHGGYNAISASPTEYIGS